MKKLIVLLSLSIALSSCAAVGSPVLGLLWTDLKTAGTATSNPVATKVGTGQASSILGLVATGDASIESAARQAGITRISHVDFEVKNILGIYATYTIFVYGE